ncbi:hypothetical protein T12_14842 [Trichinella patagoniensis]|uniref:Uncharacterized protein n=2 Tax=Trichinella patagoniensis TaxID=990121 RepID=A0A0V0Z5H9_9BILA|nr:hypothetical protein T12_14842 [Trichinella patagoniensis]
MPKIEAELEKSIGNHRLHLRKNEETPQSFEFLSPDQSFSASQLHSSTASPDVVCMTFDRLFQLLTVSVRQELSLTPAPDCEYVSIEIPCEMILMGKFLFQVGQKGFACGPAQLKGILLSSVRHHTWLVISSTKAQQFDGIRVICSRITHSVDSRRCVSRKPESQVNFVSFKSSQQWTSAWKRFKKAGNSSILAENIGSFSSGSVSLTYGLLMPLRHLRAVRTWRALLSGPYAFSHRVYTTERPPYTEQLPTKAATLTSYHKRHSLPLAIFECRPDITPHRRIATIHPPCHEVSPFKPLLCSPVLVFMVNRFEQ